MWAKLTDFKQRLRRYLDSQKIAKDWRRFNKQRNKGDCNLLKSLNLYPDSILVAGCQRSGTTMVSRLITYSEGMVDYYFGADDEYDAALMLSGHVKKPKEGRYCFQTTYLNECYVEYVNTDASYRLIWVVRNPYSVVCSILYNWKRYALNELFEACGTEYLQHSAVWRYKLLGIYGLSRLERACYAYIGKTAQALVLHKKLPQCRFCVVDYERLVTSKGDILPKIYKFIDVEYKSSYADRVHAQSLAKADKLTNHERDIIMKMCEPMFVNVKALSEF